MVKQKIKIFYNSNTGGYGPSGPCPFCGEYGNLVMVESNICGGYKAHIYCMDKEAELQEKGKYLVNVLNPDQDPNNTFDMKKYSILEMVDKSGYRKQFLKNT